MANKKILTDLHIDGKVGIGTDSPDVRLEVVEASPTDGIVADFVNSTNAGGTTAAIKLSNADSESCDVVLGANRVGANFGSDFFISLSDSVDGSNQERFRITEAGNVGIGTTSPSEKLNVDGNILATGTVLGSNLSGTNTGDQDLSGYLLNTTDTFTGNLSIANTSFTGLSLTRSTVNGSSIDFNNSNGLLGRVGFLSNGSLAITNGTVGTDNMLAIDSSGNISANNLSGTNTGDQDLSGYVTLAGAQTITGDKTFDSNLKFATTSTTSYTVANADASGLYIETTGSTAALSDMRIQARSAGAGNYTSIAIKPSNQTILLRTNSATALTISGSQAATFSSSVSATSFKPTNIVTDKIVKFDGTTLSSSSISDTGSLVSFSTAITSTGTVTGSNLSGTNTGDQDLSGYLLNTSDTFTGSLTIVGDIRGNNPLVLNVGESFAYATGQTGEILYVNSEGGLQVNSSPDNWVSLWAGRNTATINNNLGNSSFPGDVSATGAVTGSNLSGTNTGDQDLSTYALLTDITGTNSGTNTGDQDLSGYALTTALGDYLPLTGGTLTGAASEVLKIASTSQPYVRWVENGTNVGFLQFGSSGAYLSNQGNTNFNFRTNNLTRMVISADGNVTMTGTVGASNLSGTNTGDQTLAGLNGLTNNASDTLQVDHNNDTSLTIRNNTSGTSGSASLDLRSSGNNFDLTNYSDLFTGKLNVTEFKSTAGGSSFQFSPASVTIMELKGSEVNINDTLTVTSASLGSLIDDTTTQAIFSATNTNASKLYIQDYRDAAGADWTFAGKRIQERIDSTWMGYMQFNGSGNNGGISFGTGTNAAQSGVAERMVISSAGNVTMTGTVGASNLSGTNTGDQDLSGYLLNTADTFTGTHLGDTLHLGGSSITGSAAVLQVNGFQRTGNIYLHEGANSPTANSKVLGNNAGVLEWSGDAVWHAGNLTISGTNTGDQVSGDFTHDDLIGFVANEHIDWTVASTGTVHITNLPATAITSVQIAATEIAMLALTTQEGDVVVRSDENKTYMHNGGTAGTIADFTELATPTSDVTSVDGATGAVVLDHDTLAGFVANEHIDWTIDQGATNINAGNYTDTNTFRAIHDTPVDAATTTSISSNWAFDNVKTAVPSGALFTDTNTQNTYVSSDFTHDDLTGFVANEHIDWTTDQGATNINAGNYTDTNTFRAISSTPTNGATTTSISSDWAFDNVKTAVPSGAVFTDTTYDLSGYLLNTTDVFTGTLSIASSAVPFKFEETGYTGQGKYWRQVVDGGNMRFDSCTTGDGLFTPYDSFSISKDGDVSASNLSGTNTGDQDLSTYALTSAIPTNNNQLTNGAGYTTNTGTVTEVSGTGGLAGSGIGSVSISVDYSGAGNIIDEASDGTVIATGDKILYEDATDTVVKEIAVSSLLDLKTSVTGSSGSCTGNAATATLATTATTSNLIKVNNYTGATNMRILGSHQTGGSDNVYSNASMYLNCDTGIINATGFVGALTGNATTATTLQTARTIAGVSFNGSANISLNNNAITNGAGYLTAASTQSKYLRSDANDRTTGNLAVGSIDATSGIGSTRILKVSSTGNSEVNVDHSDGGTGSDIGLFSFSRNGDHLAHMKATHDGSTSSAFLSFHTQTSGGSYANAAANERMRITSSGDIGIGKTAPGLKVDIVSGANNGLRVRQNDTTNTWNGLAMLSYVTEAQADALGDQSYIFTTNPSGQTETAFSKFGGLVIQGRDDGNSSFAIRLGNGAGFATRMFMGATGATTFSNTVTATNFILSSDSRLKEKVEEVDNKHIDVDWKTFEMKSDKGQKRYGVIAQELEEVHPEFVRTDDKGMKSVAYVDLLIAKNAELEARLEKLERLLLDK